MKTRYGYRDAVSGFFEFPTDNARRILPSHLEPVELHHGTSIFSMTVFDFTESMVGPYGEVVMSVIVSPLVKPGERLPKSAFYPYRVATTTRAAREHAIERWHLPHWMEDVEIHLRRDARSLTAKVTTRGAPALEFTVTARTWQPAAHLYQSFQRDHSGSYLASFVTDGEQSEHEDEAGRIVLHDTAFNDGLAIAEVAQTPFREIWGRRGCQLFEPLLRL